MPGSSSRMRASPSQPPPVQAVRPSMPAARTAATIAGPVSLCLTSRLAPADDVSAIRRSASTRSGAPGRLPSSWWSTSTPSRRRRTSTSTMSQPSASAAAIVASEFSPPCAAYPRCAILSK